MGRHSRFVTEGEEGKFSDADSQILNAPLRPLEFKNPEAGAQRWSGYSEHRFGLYKCIVRQFS
jgi:hypothetical protein